jgi:MYXO-CTERM domain-containing protein
MGKFIFDGTMDYPGSGSPAQEPGMLGIVGLAGVITMRRRRNASTKTTCRD